MMKRFRQWSGLQNLVGKQKANSQREELEQFAEYERQVQQFPERMDRFLDIISKAYFMTDNIDAIFDPSRPQEGETVSRKGVIWSTN